MNNRCKRAVALAVNTFLNAVIKGLWELIFLILDGNLRNDLEAKS